MSKYAPSLLANPRDLMNRFMTGVSELVEEEYCTTMLLDYMDISRLMVFAQKIEESNIMKEIKRVRIESEGSDGHGRYKNRQKSFGQGYYSNPTYEKSMSTPDLLALGFVRNMRLGARTVQMVYVGVVRMVI